MDNHTKKILGLKDPNLIFSENWLEEKKVKGVTAHVIKGLLTYVPPCCEKCGIKNEGQIIKNGTHTTRTQLPKFNQYLTLLELKRTRFLCRNCGKTFHARTNIVNEHCHLSKQLTYQIALDLQKNISRKMIAETHFVSDVTVQRVLHSFGRNYKPNLNFLPEVLCVDEFKSMKSCDGAMSFVCVDGQTNQLIEILEDRRLPKLIRHFMTYDRKARLNVKYLVMDMNAAYHQLIRTVFPNAEIVIDRFHIVQHINRSFNQLRVKIMNSFRSSSSEDQKKYRRLKRFYKLLLKDSEDLDYTNRRYNHSFKRPLTQKDIVDELLGYDDTLRLAYNTCQLLRYDFNQKDSDSFFERIQELDKRLPDWFRKKLTFFKKYQKGIHNALQLPYSNGGIEGINNKIKVIKRVAYGYRNFRNFRDRIYLIQGLFFTIKKQIQQG